MNHLRSCLDSILVSPDNKLRLQQYECLTASGQAVSVMAANQEQAFIACFELLSDTPGNLYHIRLCHEW